MRIDQAREPARHIALLKAAVAAIALSLTGASVAAAADIYGLGHADAPTYDWSGVYLGGVMGYSWGKDRTTEYDTATGVANGMFFDYNPKGLIGGVKAGVNYQMGDFVVGAEGDFEMTNIQGTFIDRVQNLGRGDDNYDWQASLRARMGMAFDRVLVYGTGGVAVGKISNTYTLVPFGITETMDDVRAGWTAGAGVDYAVTDNVIAGIEWRFTKYNDFKNVSTAAFPGITGGQEPSFNSLRISLSYKF